MLAAMLRLAAVRTFADSTVCNTVVAASVEVAQQVHPVVLMAPLSLLAVVALPDSVSQVVRTMVPVPAVAVVVQVVHRLAPHVVSVVLAVWLVGCTQGPSALVVQVVLVVRYTQEQQSALVVVARHYQQVLPLAQMSRNHNSRRTTCRV